jgi:hypothetical protein
MFAPRRQSRGLPNRLQSFHLPAPIGGLNTISPGVEMPSSDCSFLFNMIAAEMGLRSRLGWREWCTNLAGEQVRSILPYTGSTKDGANNRLFACTTSGIWDCSASVVGPTKVVTFATQNVDSGWGTSSVFETAAGYFLVFTDEANGMYVYTEAGATWAKVAQGAGGNQINGVNPALFVFVLAWKNRLWFVERDTGRGWYLAVGAIFGTATQFYFGNRFQHGGDLRCLSSWTYDGGAGMDDALVAVSGGGDVLIYQGTDPSQMSSFALQGVWFVGSVPVGRRLCTDFGGDLLIMCSLGIIPLSKLVTGLVLYDRSQYRTHKITNLFNQLQAATSSLRGWTMRLHPLDACLMVLAPTAVGQASQQLAMSLSTQGWSQYRDMPMGVCAEPWEGSFFFGTEDGRVCVNDGYLDGVTLAAPGVSTPIGWSLLSSYSNLGRTTQKRVQLIRPTVLSQGGGIAFQARAQFGWDLSEQSAPAGATSVPGGAWDTALWDTAIWGGTYQAQSKAFGGAGVGREMAIAVRGSSSSRMTLTGIDVAWDEGGLR